VDLRLVLELRTGADVAREWPHLSCGGAFVRGVQAPPNQRCVLVLIGPDGAQLELTGKTVYRSDDGVGVQLDDLDGARKEQVHGWLAIGDDLDPPTTRATPMPTVRFASEPPPEALDTLGALDAPTEHDATPPVEAPADQAEEELDPVARNVFQGLRNLSVVEQLKIARDGEIHERMALERIYGKTVWEALLRNPRVTHPEVARIARMGALPRPLLDLIVGNTAWLRSPEVRRALLGNLRLGADQVPRILRLLPKHELRMVPAQSAYPSPVREAARRMIRELEKQT
jgi:hypothetical protein